MLFDTAAPDPAAGRRLRRKTKLLGALPFPLLCWLLRTSLGRLLRVPDAAPQERAELALAAERLEASIRRVDRRTFRAHADFAADFFTSTASGTAGTAGTGDGLWRGPTLVIRSADDPAARRRPDLTAAYGQAEVVELDGVGHLGSLLRTDLYVDAAQRFLRRLFSAWQRPRAGSARLQPPETASCG